MPRLSVQPATAFTVAWLRDDVSPGIYRHGVRVAPLRPMRKDFAFDVAKTVLGKIAGARLLRIADDSASSNNEAVPARLSRIARKAL